MSSINKVALEDISVRTEFNSDDIEYIMSLHGDLYKKEYNYGIEFKNYVDEGLKEFARKYKPERNRLWLCEHNKRIVGCLIFEDKGDAAQLRFFLLIPEYRGIGLGRKLMDLFIQFLKQCNFDSAYLWTTNELETAAALYEKFGFILTEKKTSNRFGKFLTEQRYDLKII